MAEVGQKVEKGRIVENGQKTQCIYIHIYICIYIFIYQKNKFRAVEQREIDREKTEKVRQSSAGRLWSCTSS